MVAIPGSGTRPTSQFSPRARHPATVASRLLALGIVLLFAAAPADAQKTTFNPSISIGFAYTDNVQYLDQPGPTTGDTAVTAGVVLPLVRLIDQGALRLTYGANRLAYQDEGQFDNTEQRVSFDFFRLNRRQSTWRVTTRYVKSDEQTSPILPTDIVPDQTEGPDDADLSLTSRTDRETIDARVGYDWRIGPAWGLNVGFAAGESTFSGGTDVEDRTWWGPSVSMRNTISRRTSLGAGYNFRRVDLDTGGSEDFQQLDVFFDRGLSRAVQFELHVGGFTRSPEDSKSETSVFGTANVRFNNGLTLGPVRLDFLAGVSPSKGGALTGTSLNSTAGFSISGVRTYPVNWRIGSSYNHRSPFESGEPTTETLRVAAGVEPKISRLMGLRFASSYTEQTSEDPTLEATYTQARLTLVIYPLGRNKISGRQRSASVGG